MDRDQEAASAPSSKRPRQEQSLPPGDASSDTDENLDDLSLSQRNVVEMAKSGQSFFFTGDPGTGKSYVLMRIVDILKKKHRAMDSYTSEDPTTIGTQPPPESSVYVTAPTGIAAYAIGGTTLHQFIGLGLVNPADNVYRLANRLRSPSSESAHKRWTTANVLVIDECSMLDPQLFERVEEIARRLRGNQRPFGGIQVILSGDFFQLPPVFKDDEVPKSDRRFDKNGNVCPRQTLFESPAWERVVGHRTMLLTENFRQTEKEFLDVLADIRLGRLTSGRVLSFLRRSSLAIPAAPTASVVSAAGSSIHCQVDQELFDKYVKLYEHKDDMTEMFTTRNGADQVNTMRLARIHSDEHVYRANDYYKSHLKQDERDKRSQQWMAPETLTLKKDARVMLICNVCVANGLCNGVIGHVVGFSRTNKPVVKFPSRASRRKTPPPSNDTPGSSTRAASAGECSSATLSKENASKMSSNRIAIVDSTAIECSDDDGFIVVEIGEHEFSSMMGSVKVASRTQIPLILAWAITIHKSQGMSLDRCQISVDRIFERGQFYVAVSRCRTIDGLTLVGTSLDRMVRGMQPLDVFLPDQRVVKFYELIKRINGHPATVTTLLV